MTLSQEDIKNLITLISSDRLTLRGNEAVPVAVLQQKLQSMLTPEPVKDDKTKKDAAK